jgi:hypothetical protein
MVREDPRVSVSELYRDVTDSESCVSQVDTSPEHSSAYDETLGRIQPSISEAAIKRTESNVCARRNIFGSGVLVWLVQSVGQDIHERRRQTLKPGLKLFDQGADLRDRTHALEGLPKAERCVVRMIDDDVLQSVVRHVRDSAHERGVDGDVGDEWNRCIPANEPASPGGVHGSVGSRIEHDNTQRLEPNESLEALPGIRDAELVMGMHRSLDLSYLPRG